MRRRLRLLVMLFSAATVVALCQGVVFLAAPVGAPAVADAAQGTGGQFVPVQGRVLDTRPSLQVGPYNTPMVAGVWRKVTLAGMTMADGSQLPANMSAVAVNFGVIAPAGAGYLNADKDDDTPNASFAYMRYLATDNQSNKATIAVADNGKIQVRSSQNTNLFIDIQGYYTADDTVSPGGYVPVAPKRIIDTYNAIGIAKAKLAGGSTTTIPVSSSTSGVPAGASAAIVNITTINHTSNDNHYFVPYPADKPQPAKVGTYFATSNTDATESQVALSTTGSLTGAFKLYVSPGPYTVDIQVDVLGYFLPGSSAGAFTPAAARVYATGNYDSANPPRTTLAAGATRTVQVTGVNGVPPAGSGIGAMAMHLSVFDHGTNGGYVAMWANGRARPSPYSSVNLARNALIGNAVTTEIGTNGAVSLYNGSQDSVDVLVDVEGWYSPLIDAVPQAALCATPNEGGCEDQAVSLSLTPNLSATTSAPYDARLTYQFEVWSTSDLVTPNATVASGAQNDVPAGVAASWQVPQGSLADNTGYMYRVRAVGAASSSLWSGWFLFDVNLQAGDTVSPGLAPGQIDNQTAMGSFRTWIEEYPDVRQYGFVDASVDVDAKVMSLWWVGGAAAVPVDVTAEAQTRSITLQVRSVQYSKAAMDAAANLILDSEDDSGWSGYEIQGVGETDESHDGLTVEVAAVSAATQQMESQTSTQQASDPEDDLSRLQATAVRILNSEAPAQSGQRSATADNPSGDPLGVQVTIVPTTVDVTGVTRIKSKDAFYAGANIVNGDGQFCTTGFAVSYGGKKHTTTARHCPSGSWYSLGNGNEAAGSGNVLAKSSQGGAVVLSGGGVGRVFDGSWDNGTGYYKKVTNFADLDVGDYVCTSGAQSGVHCSNKVVRLSYWIHDLKKQGNKKAKIQVITARQQKSDDIAVAGGDSGGPVIIPQRGGRTVLAAGMIQAGGFPTPHTDLGGQPAYQCPRNGVQRGGNPCYKTVYFSSMRTIVGSIPGARLALG